MNDAKHTPGALRAEEVIRKVFPNWPMRKIPKDSLAEIIDHETNAPELLEALEEASALMDAMAITDGMDAVEHPIRIKARVIIAKAKGES